MTKIIGILPAAGKASRLHPFTYPKELLPVYFLFDDKHNKVNPKIVAEYSLLAMKNAGINSCLIIISDSKNEIIRYFSNGARLNINIAYLHQETVSGMSGALNIGFEWFKKCYVSLALPDTIFYPFDAISILWQKMQISKSDLILGVFPTDKPEQLGPVRIEENGRVTEILEKPTNTDIFNTWGTAIWSPRFSELFHKLIENSPGDSCQSIGYFFNIAILQGLKVEAHYFEDGRYFDLGTPEGIGSLFFDYKPIL
jgi:glucose-1-phosphate thymidylyltransferase